MSYCLFLHNYLKARNVKINEHFTYICVHMSNVTKQYFGVEKENEESRERWRRAADWGLHFLSSPIPIVDYKNIPNKINLD